MFRVTHFGHLIGDVADETIEAVVRYMNAQSHYQILQQQQGGFRPPVPQQQQQQQFSLRPNAPQFNSGNSNNRCFNCGSASHFAKNCPQPRRNNPGQNSNQNNNKGKGKRQMVQVRQGRVNFTTLADLPAGAPVMTGTFSIHNKPAVVLFDSG